MTLCLAIKVEEYNMNLKKVTQKNADGSSISYEFDVPKMQGVPDHPGDPKGTDTVPAWLTPGEFVVNAEATRMFEPQIEAMNDAGRAVQRQQGGTIPEYKADGGGVDANTRRAHDYVPSSPNSPLMSLIGNLLAPDKPEVKKDVTLLDSTSINDTVTVPVRDDGTITDYGIPADAKGNINDLQYSAMSNPSEQSYTYKPGQTEDRNQNIYNFAYEGKIGLDTVPNATPFDKSIIMQAMNDAQGNSEVPMDTSVPEPITPGYVPQYGVNRDPKYAETIKQYAPTGDEFSLGDVYDSFIKPKDVEQMEVTNIPDSSSPASRSYYNPRLNATREVVPVQREDRSLLETLFGTAGSILPLGYTDKAKAEETLATLKTQRDNAAKSGNVDIVPRIDADIEQQEAIINSSNDFNQEVATASSINDTRDLNDQIERVVYSNASEEDKKTSLLGLNLTAEDVDKVLKDKSKVKDITDSNEKDAAASSIIEVVNDKDAAEEAAKIKEEEAIKAGLDYIENIENIKSGKGPSNGDTGDIYTDSFLDKAEGLLSSVGSFFKDNFSTLLDDDKLKNAALLYLGSRAMGYSHAGSLNFVGKRYMGQIESKLKTADEAALTGKYSKESISKYRDTGNPSDLVMNKAFSIVGTKDMVDPKTGKTVAVTTYKDDNTGKLIHQSVDGKPIPNIGSLRTQADEDAKFNNFKRTIVSNIEGELKRIPDEEARANISSAIPNPQGFAGEAYEVGRKLGLDTAKVNSLVPSMIREMIRDADRGVTINETAVQSYFNKQLINLSLEEHKVKANLNNANTQELSEINAMIPNSSNPVVLSTFWRGAGEAFGNLSNKEKKFYSDRADEKLGITPIMVFVKEELSELSK